MKNTEKQPRANTTKFAILGIVIAIYACIVLAILIPIVRRGPKYSAITTFCFDDNDIFSESEENLFNQQAKRLQKKYGINVFVSTCKRIVPDTTFAEYHEIRSKYSKYGSEYYESYDTFINDHSRAEKVGTDFLSEHGFSESSNVVVIIINSQKDETHAYNYHFDIYTYGTSASKITNKEIKRILFSKAGDSILEGSQAAVSGTNELMNHLGVAYAWIYGSNWIAICIVSALISGVSAILVGLSFKKRYSKERAVKNYSYEDNTKLVLTTNEDTYSHRNLTFTIIETNPTSTGSGTGSSGRSIGSGGGGGSGHRGGR